MGKTVIVAEHRLYYLMDIADRVIYLKMGELSRICLPPHLGGSVWSSFNQWAFAPSIRLTSARYQRHLWAAALLKSETSCFLRKDGGNEYPAAIRSAGSDCGNPWGQRRRQDHFCKVPVRIGEIGKGTLQIGQETLGAKQRIKKCYMVMQDVNHQLLQKACRMKFC